MNITNLIPPNPQHVVLKKIYPWDEYNMSLIMAWLYEQAVQTGFEGTIGDFKLRYGEYIATLEPEEVYDLIDHYNGDYHITPLGGIQQTLNTKNKLLVDNIVVEPIPDTIAPPQYEGSYSITPLAGVNQILRTTNKLLTDDITIQQIPYQETSNNAGGYTVIIG